jgi:type II secretory pathway component PulK
MKARARTERGAALLVAIVSIAVLTAMAVNLAYESRVALRIAANARDELRASYLARSGVALSRLVLSFQQQLDGPQQLAGAAGAAMQIPRIQLWRLLPVDSTSRARLSRVGRRARRRDPRRAGSTRRSTTRRGR